MNRFRWNRLTGCCNALLIDSFKGEKMQSNKIQRVKNVQWTKNKHFFFRGKNEIETWIVKRWTGLPFLIS